MQVKSDFIGGNNEKNDKSIDLLTIVYYNYKIQDKKGDAQMDNVKNAAGTSHTDPAEIVADPPAGESAVSAGKIVLSRPAEHAIQPEYSYRPDSPLIESVSVYPWRSEYAYYERFVEAAIKFSSYEADECPYVPFFSYMPQYYQMKPEQLQYYFYLRSAIDEEKYPAADNSYLLLLIYETINLSDRTDPEKALQRLCSILEGYSESFPRIVSQLSEWICDFCLINRLPPPTGLSDGIYSGLVLWSSLREFYFSVSDSGSSAPLISFLHGYYEVKSRFSEGAYAELYARHMSGAVSAASDIILRRIPEDGDGRHSVFRDAYVGALCIPRIKKKMKITYVSLSRSYNTRIIMTDFLKYCENRIRAAAGVRSRLSHGKPDPELKEAADRYFDEAFPPVQAKKRDVPDYEKLYDLPSNGIDPGAAKQIEESSWETTQKLIDAFDGDEDHPDAYPAGISAAQDTVSVQESAEADAPTSGDTVEGLSGVLSDNEKEFTIAAFDCDAEGERAAAAKEGVSPILMADRINSAAFDVMGDVILEDAGGCFTVIGDYREEIEAEVLLWITKT